MVTTGYLERDLEIGSLKLHYQEWGSPSSPTVLMVHGFGVSGHMFDEFAERMQDRYHLIALDQRGHGDSEWSADGDYSREAFVADIEGFAGALSLDRFVLMGHSMGGLNAVSYTVKNPERVRALILVDVGPEAAKEGVDNIVRFTRGPDELEFEEFVEMAHRFNPRRTLDNIRERMRHRLKQTEGGKWTWKFDKRFRDARDGLRVGSELSNDETWQLFRGIRVPTLLVRGAESDVLTPEVAERVVAEMPRARLSVVARAGHSVPGDNPDDFTAMVREFLADVDGGKFAPVSASEPPPLDALMEEHEVRAQRRGIPILALILVGVTAVLALAGVSFALKKRHDSKSRARAHRQALNVTSRLKSVDIDRARLRAADTASTLAGVGKSGVARAKHSLESVDLERARESAHDLLAALGETARHAPATARTVAPLKVDRKKLRKRAKSTARRGKSGAMTAFELAAKAAPLLLAAGRMGRKPAKKSHRVARWRH